VKTSKWALAAQILKWTLISLAALVILISLFYAEEDWRGKNDWENCKRHLEAKGESLNWNDYVPPPVPDDQNFFKAPKMADWFVATKGQAAPNELAERLSNPDTNVKITTKTAASNYLEWCGQFEPDFNQISEALQRPYYRIDGDYTQPLAFPNLNSQAMKFLSMTLAQRANCYLALNQPQKALDEITLLNNLRRLTEAAPSGKPMTLVAALLNSAVVGVYVTVITNGLQSHIWQEPQLVTLEQQLKQINLFVFMADAVREDRVSTLFAIQSGAINKINPNRSNLIRGWLYQNLISITMWCQQIIDGINVSNNKIAPDKFDKVESEIAASGHFRPYTFFVGMITPNFSPALKTFAYNQTLANEAQIACALERYRLAHSEDPETLDSLVPQFIGTIPHDMIGGQPLHYRRTNDGKFLLYSIGWNEKDDGGQPSPHNKTGGIEYTNGDWIWPN
jgi:hypothetical protein